jgi:hypothetical protein
MLDRHLHHLRPTPTDNPHQTTPDTNLTKHY